MKKKDNEKIKKFGLCLTERIMSFCTLQAIYKTALYNLKKTFVIELNKKQIFYLIGIGAFILATIIGFTYFVRVAFRDIQIWFDQEPILNYWITECSLIIVYVLLGIISLRTIKTQKDYSENKLRKIFFLWIIAFIVSQLFQFLYTIFGTDFVLENRLDEFSNYTDFIRKEYLLNSYQSLFAILRYLIFAIMIFVAGKTVENRVNSSAIK